jgi:hypothetical protein
MGLGAAGGHRERDNSVVFPADNVLLTDDRVVIVDWPYACRGAAFVDVVILAACALAGYFTQRSLEPPPPGIPTVRAFQAAQGEITRRWLADLI